MDGPARSQRAEPAAASSTAPFAAIANPSAPTGAQRWLSGGYQGGAYAPFTPAVSPPRTALLGPDLPVVEGMGSGRLLPSRFSGPNDGRGMGEQAHEPRTDIGDPNGFMARALRGFMGVPDSSGFNVARGVGQAAGIFNPMSTVTSIGGRLMGSALLDNRVENAAWAKTPSLPSQSALLAQSGPLGGFSTEANNRPDLRNYSPDLATLLRDKGANGSTKSGPGGRDGRGGSRGPGDSRGGSGYGGGGTRDRGNSGRNAGGGALNK